MYVSLICIATMDFFRKVLLICLCRIDCSRQVGSSNMAEHNSLFSAVAPFEAQQNLMYKHTKNVQIKDRRKPGQKNRVFNIILNLQYYWSNASQFTKTLPLLCIQSLTKVMKRYVIATQSLLTPFLTSLKESCDYDIVDRWLAVHVVLFPTGQQLIHTHSRSIADEIRVSNATQDKLWWTKCLLQNL